MKKEIRKNRRKRRNKRRLLSLLVIFLLSIYLPAIWNWLFSVNVEVGAVQTATLELKIPLKGVLIRKEKILTSPGDGILIPKVQYGNKVAVNSEVASFINSDMREVFNNYKQKEIEILKRVVSKFENSIGSEREIWENAIVKQIEKLTDYSNLGDLSKVSSIKSSIDLVLDARAHYMLDSSDIQDEIKTEKEELNKLEASINKSVAYIKAPSSGVVSYHCDGLEDVYTPDKLDGITVESIDSAILKEDETEKWITPQEIPVSQGQGFAKLVTNDQAWFVFYISSTEGEEIRIKHEKLKLDNKEYLINIEIGGISERVPIKIDSIREVSGEKYLIISRINKYIELTMDRRGIAGSLVQQSVTGMKVPLKSLFNENDVDQTADIIIIEMNKAVYKRVRIIAKQDSYAIIENLDAMDQEKCVNVFDIYVVNPKNIEEGQVIEK